MKIMIFKQNHSLFMTSSLFNEIVDCPAGLGQAGLGQIPEKPQGRNRQSLGGEGGWLGRVGTIPFFLHNLPLLRIENGRFAPKGDIGPLGGEGRRHRSS